ncbi:type III secretion system HrpP C-terminal domain-containing protein [Salinicola avicenniae]|uniref:type III secretion system HrpP C-terminal domain-containing protein n=1 Tax=Salinicola avicenniae TaxID=2916836 RepID=UPI0020737C9F|nr:MULTISPECIES: type III secretion system HrpP C-terminal domain-containing protein [unclassified Salinicola]
MTAGTIHTVGVGERTADAREPFRRRPEASGGQASSLSASAARGGGMSPQALDDTGLRRFDALDLDALDTWGDDGALFAHLLSDPLPAALPQSSPAEAELTTGFGSAAPSVLAGELVKSLAPPLQAASTEALEVGIHLPRLGRIRVSARQDANGWCMTLHPEQAATRALLGQQQTHCETALGAALGQTVALYVGDDEGAV